MQSVYELVHSEDREELQRQLGWNSFIGPDDAGVSLQELLTSGQLQRHFIDAVNQGNWSLSIKLRLECFVIVA